MLVLGITFFFMKFYGSGIVAYVSLDVNHVMLRELAFTGSQFILSGENAQIPVTSAKVSGTIVGNGSVQVFMRADGKDSLVYSNEPVPFKSPLITGFAVYSDETAESLASDGKSHLIVGLKDMKIIGDEGNILTGIALKSVGNENGMYLEKIRVSWTPNNDEHLQGIRLNGDDFWGFNRAGTPFGAQPSGAQLTAWGQAIPYMETRIFDEFRFDRSIEDKQILIELYYNDYLPGFRLGDDRFVKIFLDLSGVKESYIEEEEGKLQFSLEKKQRSVTRASSDTGAGTSPGTTQGARQGTPGAIAGNATAAALQEGSASSLAARGFSSLALDDGTQVYAKALEEASVSFPSLPSLKVNFQIVENASSRALFEQSNPELKPRSEVTRECKDTCAFPTALNPEQVEFVFHIEEGTAFNVSSIEFS